MGWKGTLRSVSSELKRQSREAEKRHRQQQKEIDREEALEIVQQQEEFLHSIISLHHECRASFDWNSVEPQKPNNTQPLTDQAKAKLENFKPNFVDRILRIQDWRKKKLEGKIVSAKLSDEKNNVKALENYESLKHEWDKNQCLAKRLRSDGNAAIEALQESLDIKDLPIGKDVQIEMSDEMQIDVNLKVLPYEDVVPEEIYSLRQSGALSIKKMPKGKGLELYQDHVCSALLRIARETLGVMPADIIRANAVVNAVSTQTGHLEDQIIVSAVVARDTLNKINLSKIDPSDSLSNFVHNMQFRKTKGFESVDKVSLS